MVLHDGFELTLSQLGEGLARGDRSATSAHCQAAAFSMMALDCSEQPMRLLEPMRVDPEGREVALQDALYLTARARCERRVARLSCSQAGSVPSQSVLPSGSAILIS